MRILFRNRQRKRIFDRVENDEYNDNIIDDDQLYVVNFCFIFCYFLHLRKNDDVKIIDAKTTNKTKNKTKKTKKRKRTNDEQKFRRVKKTKIIIVNVFFKICEKNVYYFENDAKKM